jgi:5-methylcytosine-specific restriction endonuclease McrBC GTP-binding regulatory subunit McrB
MYRMPPKVFGSSPYRSIMQYSMGEIISILDANRFIILEGIPGVGKTHLFNQLKEEKIGKKKIDKTYFLTFHPSTDYSDFVGGIKPGITSKKKLQFQPSPGRILNAINDAKNGKSVLIWIDEINRANVPQVFGDLITLLGNSNPPTLNIPSVGLDDDLLELNNPKGLYGMNFYIVATLNQSDKSVTPLDAAIRRRFGFLSLTNLPIDHKDIQSLTKIPDDEKNKFYTLNEFLANDIGPEEQIGHSYLFKLNKLQNLQERTLFWRHKIIPNVIEFLPRNKSLNLHKPINAILDDPQLGIESVGAENNPTFISRFDDSFDYTDKQTAKAIGDLLEMNSNVVLEGVPGTGKTRIRNHVCKELGITEANVISKTFHPSTSYQEFIGGLFPTYEKSNPDELLFKFREGTLIKAANLAMNKKDEKFLLFIDEINRGNIPLILGELMTIIENTKRVSPDGQNAYREYDDTRKNQVIVHHEDGKTFSLQLPKNLYVLATMNTSDRSVISFDAALRRRFAFFRLESLLSDDKMTPEFRDVVKQNWKKYQDFDKETLNEVLDCLIGINSILRDSLGPDAELGHSYCFLKGEETSLQKPVQRLFHNKILPQLADTISSQNYSPELMITNINLLLSNLSSHKRLCEKGLVLHQHKINPNFSQIRLDKEGLNVEITLPLIRALQIEGGINRSFKERAYFLLLLSEELKQMKQKPITRDYLSNWYRNVKKTIMEEFQNGKLSTVRQNISDERNDPPMLKLVEDLIRNPSIESELIQDYLTYKPQKQQEEVNKVRWVVEELINSFPNFRRYNMKKIGNSKLVYRFEKLEPNQKNDSVWDASFEILKLSKSKIEIEFQSSSNGRNGRYHKAYAESLIPTIVDSLKMRIISMGTKDGRVFTDVPNFNDPEIPRKIGEWNRRWGKKPGEGSGNAGIKIVIENKSESEDKEYIARIISGHPVWIQSE